MGGTVNVEVDLDNGGNGGFGLCSGAGGLFGLFGPVRGWILFISVVPGVEINVFLG